MTILATGQVTASQSAIFKVDGADVLKTESVTISKISFFNENSAEQTSILSLKKFGSTSRILAQFKLLQNERGEYLEPSETLPLDNGDILEAETTTDNAVNFAILGTRS